MLPIPRDHGQSVIDGDGLATVGTPGLGLIEPNVPTPVVPDQGDNVDAYSGELSETYLAAVVKTRLELPIRPMEPTAIRR
jgi:hypothetical protein